MNLSYQFEEIEILMREALNKPTPEPNFQMWQRVSCHGHGSRIEGQIVGILYVSPGTACVEDSEPGWNYTVQASLNLHIFREDQTTAV